MALCTVVNRQKLKNIDVFGKHQNPNLLVNKCYSGVLSGKIRSAEDAALVLYGNSKEPSRKVRAILKRLEDKLINTLFFIDEYKYGNTDESREKLRTHLTFSAVQVLKHQNQLVNANRMAEKCLTKALRLDMIDLAYLLCQDIVQYYNLLHYSKKNSNRYIELERSLFHRLVMEKYANRCFVYLGAIINQNKQYASDQIPDDIVKEMGVIENELNRINDYDFNFKTRNSIFFKAWLERDILKMKKVAREALDFFSSKSELSILGQFSFIQKLGFIHERSGNFKEAISLYTQALSLKLVEGGTSWYNVRSHLFDAHLHMHQYLDCFTYLSEVVSHSSFKKLFSNYREPWIIREAYFHLLLETNNIDVMLLEAYTLRKFSLTRFRNDIEQFSKDKRGLNIAIIIVQALFYLARDQKELFENKIQSLNQYSMRYLRQNDTLRSNAFIKMLQKLPETNYHPLRWQAHTKKLLNKIFLAKKNMHFQSREQEIIPYEQLVKLIIDIIRNQKNGVD